MSEKDIRELSDNIVESIVALSLGKEPGLISGKIFKTIAKHPKYEEMKKLYIEFLFGFDGHFETTEELKKLSDFRFALVQLFEQGNLNTEQ